MVFIHIRHVEQVMKSCGSNEDSEVYRLLFNTLTTSILEAIPRRSQIHTQLLSMLTELFRWNVRIGLSQIVEVRCRRRRQDGLMEDPRQCKVDVAALTGLTDAQRNVLKTIYGETKNKDGVIYPAQPFGGEGDAAGWPTWIVGVSPMMMAAQKAPSLRYAFGHRDVQELRVRRSVLGLQRATSSRTSRRTRRGGDRPERDESEPRRVQGEEPQARCSGTAGRTRRSRRSAA